MACPPSDTPQSCPTHSPGPFGSNSHGGPNPLVDCNDRTSRTRSPELSDSDTVRMWWTSRALARHQRTAVSPSRVRKSLNTPSRDVVAS